LDLQLFKGLAGFRYALRQFVAASETISRDAGVTQQQYQALLAIRAFDGGAMSIGDLARDLLLTHHAAVQLVDRLSKAGLAERARSPEDRRTVHVALTQKGAGLLDQLAAKHLQELLRQEPLLSRSLKRVKGAARRDGA
jgi:DNA-binding MarR family transcriptional regulator